MKRIQELLRRLSLRSKRAGFNDDLDEEIQFHIETRAAELEQSGISRRDAMARARREFGSTTRTREESRAAWQISWLENLAMDVRHAARGLRRAPAFTLAAMLSLAIGIGANTTIFSLTMEFLFSEPSCTDCETLAAVRLGGNSHSYLEHLRLLREAQIFEEIAGYREESEVNWRYGSEAFRLPVIRVTDNYFEAVGIPVLLGRGIRAGERDVVVLNYHFWKNRLNGDPLILGRSLLVDGRHHSVVGVLPREHRTLLGFGYSPSLYLPVRTEEEPVTLISRRAQGVSHAITFEKLKSATAEIDRVHPNADFKTATNLSVEAVAGFDRLRGKSLVPIVAFFAMLMVLVGLVLLVACTNVASLLLARSSSRQQELAIRLSLGAGRGRLIRQLLAESLLLALLGTACGLLLNIWLTTLISRVQLPLPVPILLMIEPDWRLLLYSAAVALVCAILSGLMPAFKSVRPDVHSALKLTERQVGYSRWDLRRWLVAGQIAVSVLLLCSGGLFLRNLMKATAIHPGFDVDRLVWTSVRLVPDRYSDPDARRAFTSVLLDRLRSLPGVEALSVTRIVPFNDNETRGTAVRTDFDHNPVQIGFAANRVGLDYFRTMGIPMLSGREFLAPELSNKSNVVIVNDAFARRLFGQRNPVGHSIYLWTPEPQLIIGVVANIKHFTLGEDTKLALYQPHTTEGEGRRSLSLQIMVRTGGQAKDLIRSINAAVAQLEPSAAVEVKPMRNAMGFALLPSQVGAALLGIMGLLGVLLAAVGLYGVLAYLVARRIREIGVRVALGATPGSILWMVLRQSVLMVASGAVIGLTVAAFAMKPLAMFLVPGLSSADPLTMLGVVSVLFAVACAASLGPAWRALRIDPMMALRYE
jgi:predicted permease